MTLLQLALGLLMAVSQSPNVDATFRAQAMKTAEMAIEFATQNMKNVTSETKTTQAVASSTEPIKETKKEEVVVTNNTTVTDTFVKCSEDNNRANFIRWPDAKTTSYNKAFFDEFNVDVEGRMITISIPGRMLNADKYDVEYHLAYGIYGSENRTGGTDMSFSSKNKIPFTFEVPENYLGQRVYFQLFVKYECAQYIAGSMGIKGSMESIVIKQL